MAAQTSFYRGSTGSERLVAIDALRGVAVLAVVLAHLPFSVSAPAATRHAPTSALPGWLGDAMGFGGYGVNLFFVLSGFCIHMKWARSTGAKVDFVGFWRRRLHRLYPPYFVALVGSLAGLFLLHRLAGDGGAGIGSRFGYPSTKELVVDTAVLLLLLQNFTGAYARIGNGPFWSLAVEEQLYILYFPLLRMREKLGWPGTLAIVVAITLGWRIGVTVTGSHLSTYDAPARWADWVLGAVAVEAYLGRVVLPSYCYSLPVGGVLLALGFSAGSPSAMANPRLHTMVFSDLLISLAFFVIVNAACRARWGARVGDGKIVRVLSQVGLFSYSIYLVHGPLIVAAKVLAVRLGWGTLGVAASRLFVAIAGGYAFFLLVERRFLNRPAPRASAEAVGPERLAQG